jgi:ATP-dependent Lhr-like helicase
MEAARGAELPEAWQAEAAKVLSQLEAHGALFLSQLTAHTGWTESLVRDALWEGVARGLVTADGWQALRSLLTTREQRASASGDRRSGLRRGARMALPNEGRWALLPAQASQADRDELAEAVAEQLLARWGVVFRELLTRECLALPWRDIAWALRRLEARGSIRGGRFVNGFAGEQYALPEAVELLRKIRREPKNGTLVRICGGDPLNLVGIVLSGARVPALRTNELIYCDGLLLETEAASSLGGVSLPRSEPLSAAPS